jgi:hypothetical protein
MTDEFDDIVGLSRAELGRDDAVGSQRRYSAERLVARLYRAASEPLRARMLACLLRPLGTLSMAAVAAGAFGHLLHRGGAARDSVALEDASRYSSDQILELARFVQEVNPQALAQLAGLLSDNAMGVAALSASALVLLYRRSRPPVGPIDARAESQAPLKAELPDDLHGSSPTVE